MSRELSPCGTNSAYARHIKRGEPTCQPCREAHAAYERDRYLADRGEVRPRVAVAQCGTRSGYVKHVRLGEPTCAPCRAAKADYQRRQRAARKAATT